MVKAASPVIGRLCKPATVDFYCFIGTHQLGQARQVPVIRARRGVRARYLSADTLDVCLELIFSLLLSDRLRLNSAYSHMLSSCSIVHVQICDDVLLGKDRVVNTTWSRIRREDFVPSRQTKADKSSQPGIPHHPTLPSTLHCLCQHLFSHHCGLPVSTCKEDRMIVDTAISDRIFTGRGQLIYPMHLLQITTPTEPRDVSDTSCQ